MKEKYRILKYELEKLKSKHGVLVKDSPSAGIEEKIVFRDCENLFEKLQKTIDDIEYYSRPVKTGTLRRMDNDKFELIDGNGRQISYFSCGSSIECFVMVDDKMTWASGRVEYKSKDDKEGYYFYCRDSGNPFLYDGMEARVRTS